VGIKHDQITQFLIYMITTRNVQTLIRTKNRYNKKQQHLQEASHVM